MTGITEVLALKTRYYEIMPQISTLQAQAVATKKELETTCTHPATVRNSYYDPCGYFDTAETRYWNVCALCGKKSNFTTKRGSHG